MSIEENERAHGGTSGKKVACHLIAEDDDVAFLTFVEVVQPAPQFQRKEADPVVLRFGSGELATGAGEFADRVHLIGDENGSDGANVRSFFTDVEVILVGEPILAGGVRAALNGRSAAGEEHHDVFAVLRKAALIAGSEALAEADQQNQGTDSPGDAEHGEERTQFVRPEGAENLRQDFDHHLHRVASGPWLSALGSQFSVLSSQFSVLNSWRAAEGLAICFRGSLPRFAARRRPFLLRIASWVNAVHHQSFGSR